MRNCRRTRDSSSLHRCVGVRSLFHHVTVSRLLRFCATLAACLGRGGQGGTDWSRKLGEVKFAKASLGTSSTGKSGTRIEVWKHQSSNGTASPKSSTSSQHEAGEGNRSFDPVALPTRHPERVSRICGFQDDIAMSAGGGGSSIPSDSVWGRYARRHPELLKQGRVVLFVPAEGIGARLKGAGAALLLAIKADRALLIDWPELTGFLQPGPFVDWRPHQFPGWTALAGTMWGGEAYVTADDIFSDAEQLNRSGASQLPSALLIRGLASLQESYDATALPFQQRYEAELEQLSTPEAREDLRTVLGCSLRFLFRPGEAVEANLRGGAQLVRSPESELTLGSEEREEQPIVVEEKAHVKRNGGTLVQEHFLKGERGTGKGRHRRLRQGNQNLTRDSGNLTRGSGQGQGLPAGSSSPASQPSRPGGALVARSGLPGALVLGVQLRFGDFKAFDAPGTTEYADGNDKRLRGAVDQVVDTILSCPTSQSTPLSQKLLSLSADNSSVSPVRSTKGGFASLSSASSASPPVEILFTSDSAEAKQVALREAGVSSAAAIKESGGGGGAAAAALPVRLAATEVKPFHADLPSKPQQQSSPPGKGADAGLLGTWTELLLLSGAEALLMSGSRKVTNELFSDTFFNTTTEGDATYPDGLCRASFFPEVAAAIGMMTPSQLFYAKEDCGLKCGST